MSGAQKSTVAVPVSSAAARRWGSLTDSEKARIGALVEVLVASDARGSSGLEAFVADWGRELRRSGLTDDMVDQELAAWNAERRI